MPSSHCRICRRLLKNLLSVELGIGPVCRAKCYLNDKQGEFDFMKKVDKIENWHEDIICSRDEEGIHTNVPRRIVHHSPDGFEWGYGGSGPADFALNILSIFVGQEKAEQYHQAFKSEFVETLPKKGGTIKRDDILKWVEMKAA